MSRKPNRTDEAANSYLMELVKKKSGLSCKSFADIQHLQLQIRKVTDETLSIQTLNRLFGLIKADFNTSSATLNILSRYLNYNSFVEFVSIHHQSGHTLASSGQTAEMLTLLFKDIEPPDAHESSLNKVFINIYKLIEKNESLEKEIYSFMAANPLGRKYFFENFVYTDKLNGQYGEGMSQYILHSEKNEELLFAYSIVCFRYFLSDNFPEFRTCFNKIKHFSIEEIRSFSPLVIARYGAVLICNEVVCSSAAVVTKKAREIFSLIAAKAGDEFQTGMANSILAEALLLCGAYEDAWEIMSKAKARSRPGVKAAEEISLLNQKNLIRVYAGFCARKINLQRATEEIEAIRKKPFCFLSNELYSMLLSQLMILTGNKKRIKTTMIYLDQLIEKTGFVFLKETMQQQKWQIAVNGY